MSLRLRHTRQRPPSLAPLCRNGPELAAVNDSTWNSCRWRTQSHQVTRHFVSAWTHWLAAPLSGKPRRYLVLCLRSTAPAEVCHSAMAVPMTAPRAMASMRWTVISMPSVPWMRPVMRWTVRVMMVVVPGPICRTPVVVGAAIRLIDVGIAIPVAVSRACRVATRQKQDERRDSKQFLHVRSLDVPTSLGFSICKPGFVQATADISRSFLLTCSTTSAHLAKVRRPHPRNACKQACFCSFCQVSAAMGDGSCAPPRPAQQRHCAMSSPAQACVPSCPIAALGHCSNAAMQQCSNA